MITGSSVRIMFMSAAILVIITVVTGQMKNEKGQEQILPEPKHGQLSRSPQKWVCNDTGVFSCVCSTSSTGFIVDCSHRNLTSVPDNIPEGATELILSYNQLTAVPEGAFKEFTSLETLDVSHNKLSRLGSGSFLGLTQLETLLLNDNYLNMSASTFADDVFTPLSNLKLINLKTNLPLTSTECQYPDVALGKLSSLETLHINGLSDKIFGKGFRNLTSLKTLDLSNTLLFSSVSKDTFVNCKSLKLNNLDLSHCDLVFIHREAFRNLPYIDTINYSYNRHLELKGVGISTYSLQNSTIRKIVMQSVHVQLTYTILREEDLQYLTFTHLEELDMSNNSIVYAIGLGPIFALPLSLKIFRFSWNRMELKTAQAYVLLFLRNLEQFDASNQEKLISKPDDTVPDMARASLGEETSESFNEKTSDIQSEHGKISRYFTFASDGKSIIVPLPPKLWMLNCSRIYKIRMTVGALTFLNSSLKYVNFAYNNLRTWVGPVKGAESIRHLDLTGNDCYNVSDTFFAYMTGLETLLIGNNNFREPFQSDNTFYNLTALKHLDMHNSQLETLDYNLFSRLTNLTHLNLSQNYLSGWKVNMSRLARLQTLDLSHNKLRSLPRPLCQDLDHIQAFSSVQVDIKDNPFQCVCDTEYFVEWLTTTKVRFRSLNSTFCTLANGTVRSLSASRSILGHLQQDCRSYTALIGGLCGVLALVLTIVLAKIIHRQRWKIRYLYYMANSWRKRTGYQSLDSAEENPFGYDVFVSYEDSHRTFVREQIIPRLETEAGLKLCIDKRDFVPGLYIADNILHAIQSSRKTVVLLSKAFLKSKWCMYELNMARMEGIYTGRELLVLVLTEEIPTSELSAEIIDIIHKQTYIEMTDNRYGEALFWERLVSALKSD